MIDTRRRQVLAAGPAANLGKRMVFYGITSYNVCYTKLLRYDFMERFAPHLTRDLVDKALAMKSNYEVDQLFENIQLPIR